jgi:glycosyltransferase involved in cell wall biosynthesis
MSRFTVVHAVLSLDSGGLERVVLDLTREGIGLGQRVAIVCLERPGCLAPEAEALGARVVCVQKRTGLRPSTIGRVRSVLRELAPDIIHTHQLGLLLYTGPAASCPIVHTEHGRSSDLRRRRRWIGRLAVFHAARFFCVSRDVANEAMAYRIAPHRKVHVIPNGIDLTRFEGHDGREAARSTLGIPAGAPVIGTVGRLDPLKQQDLLIRAFRGVRSRVNDAHLLIVGDGPLRRDLHEQATALGLDGCVHFAGYQACPELYLQAMDVFALTSRSEGMPLAVLEAWATSLPVVATRVGGLPEMMGDDQAGVLVDPGDEQALVGTLIETLGDPGHRRRMGAAGRLRVESLYSLHRMAFDYQRHYLKLLESRGRPIDAHPGPHEPVPEPVAAEPSRV